MQKIFDTYKNRFNVSAKKIAALPNEDTGIIVVIPTSNEPDTVAALKALEQCHKTKCSVEVIVVINSSEQAGNDIIEQNKKTATTIEHWTASTKPWFQVFILNEIFPAKHAGVGLARKTGMDEATNRFAQINKNGIIVCFDADCSCDRNYLQAIALHFESNKKSGACSVYFEHPTTGNDYPKEIYAGIVKYELHLRYYKQALAYTTFPYAFHTIGSAMAVTAETYCKAGGMNTRKAGEDFYFIHKLMPLTNYTNITGTSVIPSPRKSTRVPFGTGKAMIDICKDGTFKTYDFQCFIDLKKFFLSINKHYPFKEIPVAGLWEKAPETIQQFINKDNFTTALQRCITHSTNKGTFLKNFFQFFDAFRILKFVHFCTAHFYPKVDLKTAVKALHGLNESSNHQLLTALRSIDKSNK